MANIPPRQVALGGGAAGIAAAIALAAPFIAQHEGHTNRPYRDVGGVLTVCDGHTGRDVQIRTYTNSQCKALLNKDVEIAVQQVLTVSPELKDKPYVLAATISFSYNVGIGNYERSSVSKDFRSQQYKLGCTDMLRYVYAKGVYSPGLYNRRFAEYQICMKGT